MFFRPIRQKKARAVEDIFKVFAKLVFQGKLSAAIKLLDSESSTGLLNLTPEVLEGLKEKHPEEADIADESLLYGPINYIPAGVFDLIDEKMIFDAATKTKGSPGPSGRDAELYRRILCSKKFKTEGKILREEDGQIVPLVQSPESVVSLSSEWIKELADCQVEPTYR